MCAARIHSFAMKCCAKVRWCAGLPTDIEGNGDDQGLHKLTHNLAWARPPSGALEKEGPAGGAVEAKQNELRDLDEFLICDWISGF